MNILEYALAKKLAGGGSGGSSGAGGSGGGSVSRKAVNFMDYDGTLLYSYTADEALALSAMPDLPTQPGLTCQGWNWSLADMKSQVSAQGVCDVGATYITDDGKTRLYITIAAEGRMTVPLYISQTAANGVTIDWGDGSATNKLSGTGNVNTTHTYSSIGDYVITLTVASNCTLGFGNETSYYCVMASKGGDDGNVYCNMLQRVEIGSGVTSIGAYAFYNCYSLASITIPDSIKSIGTYAFYQCNSLASITISDSLTSISNYTFHSCYSLASITIPDSVTSISNYAFQDCYGMAFFDFTSCTAVPTLANKNAFNGIPSDCVIKVPASLLDEWKAATNWSTYASQIVAG